mmetsp:Transcript_67534/g.135675  ORF Transcript_67534/g.135675 Transcript_67534/m.135675 type:complete len:267 (-) Transcript_67534:381-1181(-)
MVHVEGVPRHGQEGLHLGQAHPGRARQGLPRLRLHAQEAEEPAVLELRQRPREAAGCPQEVPGDLERPHRQDPGRRGGEVPLEEGGHPAKLARRRLLLPRLRRVPRRRHLTWPAAVQPAQVDPRLQAIPRPRHRQDLAEVHDAPHDQGHGDGLPDTSAGRPRALPCGAGLHRPAEVGEAVEAAVEPQQDRALQARRQERLGPPLGRAGRAGKAVQPPLQLFTVVQLRHLDSRPPEEGRHNADGVGQGPGCTDGQSPCEQPIASDAP